VFISIVKNFPGYVNVLEIIEALELSGPTKTAVVTAVNTIQPRAMILGATTDPTLNKPQPETNVPDDDDVPVVTETICTQPPSSDEGMISLY